LAGESGPGKELIAPARRGVAPISSFAEAERDMVVRALDMAAGNKLHAPKTLRILRANSKSLKIRSF